MERPATWSTYYEKTKEAPPHKSLVEAVELVTEKDAALDLGAGALRDTRHLLEAGFNRVVAVDAAHLEQAHRIDNEKLEIVTSPFEAFNFPNETFNLVNAQYSLPFVSPDSFNEVFASTQRSLKPGGIFVGQLFGKNDGWSNRQKMSFHFRNEIEKLFSGMEMIKFEEQEEDGPTATGPDKHWHVFHITARK